MTKEKETQVERPHSILGGSSADKFVNCTGYYSLAPKVVKMEEDHLIEGTAGHDYSEKLLEAFLQHKLTGSDPMENVPEVDDKDIIEGATGYVESIWKEILNESITGKVYAIEDKLVMDESVDSYGYADWWSVHIDDRAKRVATIGDYKFGYVEVEAEDNWQLKFYLICLRRYIRSLGKDIDYSVGFIYQPKLPKDRRFKKAIYSNKELDRAEKKINKAFEDIFVKKKLKFKVGPWCEKCNAQGICETYIRHSERETALTIIDKDSIDFPEVGQLTLEQRLKIIKVKDSLEDFLSKVYKSVLAEMIKGATNSEFKLVRGRANRKWKEDEETTAESLAQYGIDDPYETSLKGIPAIEQELKNLHGEEESKRVMALMTIKPEGSYQLAPLGDPRPDANPIAKIARDIK